MSKGTSKESSKHEQILTALLSVAGWKVDAAKFIKNVADQVGTSTDTVNRVIRRQNSQVIIDADGYLTVVKGAKLLPTTSRVQPEQRVHSGVTHGRDHSRRHRKIQR